MYLLISGEKCGIICLLQFVSMHRSVMHNLQFVPVKCEMGQIDPHNSHNLKMYKFVLHLYILFMQCHISHFEFFTHFLLCMCHENNIVIPFI